MTQTIRDYENGHFEDKDNNEPIDENEENNEK